VDDVIQTEIRQALASWTDPEHWSKYKRSSGIPIPSPVRSVHSRIKRPEQVVDKIFRKPQNFPEGLVPQSFRQMGDAIGVRILVYCLSHLPLVDRELRSSELFFVSQEDPPRAYMGDGQVQVLSLDHVLAEEKESGYRSVHYSLQLRESSVPESDRPWFELQVRTLGMDLWSTMEHHLGYKPGEGATSVAARRQLKILSSQISAIDEHFNLLYEELNRFQTHVSYESNDAIDPANLPPVLSEAGIACAQRDINNIIKFLYSRGLETVGEVRAMATARRLELIRNTYVSVVGHLPGNLDAIACLAALRGASGHEEEVQRIKGQIAYRGAWDTIRQEFRHGGENGS
jgi:putative GTP pyrophosphokinase